MNVLVIDVGTSSIRGVLYDGKGGRLFCHQIPIRYSLPEAFGQNRTRLTGLRR